MNMNMNKNKNCKNKKPHNLMLVDVTQCSDSLSEAVQMVTYYNTKKKPSSLGQTGKNL